MQGQGPTKPIDALNETANGGRRLRGLKKTREANELSVEQLAYKSNVTAEDIRTLEEKGRAKPAAINALANSLECEHEAILKDQPPKQYDEARPPKQHE